MQVRALLLAAPVPLLLVSPRAMAQSQARDIGETAPAVFANDSIYRERPRRIGNMSLSLGLEAKLEYDSNVYAEPRDRNDDIRTEIMPRMRLATAPGPLSAELGASGNIRRFADLKTENAEAWSIDGALRWAPTDSSAASARGFVQRAIEERGDPESNVSQQTGPRKIDVLGGNLRYRRDSGHILIDVEGAATQYDAVSQRDADRDFTNYNARATFGLRTRSTVFLTATGFVTRRDFRLEKTAAGTGRNSTTFGGRVGVDIQPGGPLEGNFSAGVFRFDPSDGGVKGRTGISIAGSLVYRPRRRTAILLDVFQGDVATFRTGAQQRTDTSFRLAVQQEIRHDLFATPTFGFRQTKYNGSGDKQRIFTVGGEVEYVISRSISVVAMASYGDRDAEIDARDRYKRFRGGASVRMRF
ncbi:outer membrane beta-barrel protein [Novosphingobium panipatense]|jgi:hypothetical protein|uniref:Beta-barrel porin 2 n=2 Tax=Novosphingobium panipatense TaxID=428991 RepID=A0ABY1QKR9_9SPHN|nr:hypothetical protein SAMN06296065_10672 [Novosphingobium panipatense]